jgi:serine/threonine protein kinase
MLPPEAIGRDQFNAAFDIFQFGVTLYRMCNGDAKFYEQFARYGASRAFDRDTFRFDVRNGRFPDRRVFAPHIPAKLRTIVKKCMEIDPSNRFRSALDAANALADIDGDTLDWRLAESPDTRIWTKNKSGTAIRFTAHGDGSTECIKTATGGQARRVGAGCRALMTERDIKTFLGSN